MRWPALVVFACLPLLAGCGEEYEPVPDVFAVEQPKGAKRAVFRDAGMRFERPANWKLRRQRTPPQVFELVSGQAMVTAWAYPRDEPLPETDAQLEAARKRLVEAVEQRDPRFRLRQARVTAVAGAPAIELVGRQVISRRRVLTRSVHVFEGEVEYVIEAIAPRSSFARTARGAMGQVLRSLELEGEVSGARG